MIDQRKRIFAVSLLLLDLLLTMVSFFLAYRLRKLFSIPGYTVMEVQVYLWLLVIILATWSIVLPLFRVYSDPAMRPFDQILRLTKAIAIAWLLRRKEVSSVITGATNLKQLQENLDSAEAVEHLNDDILEKIEQILGNYPDEDET